MRTHVRLALLTFLVSGTALAAATLIWNAELRRERRTELDHRLLDQARVLARLLPPPAPEALPRIRDLVRHVHAETRMRVTVIDAGGTVLADSNVPENRLGSVENHGQRPEVREALARGVGRTERESATVHQRMAYLAVPVRTAGELHGVVRVSLPMTAVLAEERRGVARLLAAVAGSMVLAAGLGYLASRRVTRPLEGLAQTAREIADGDLSRRAELEGSVEVHEVAQALNHLAATVQEELREVESARRRLERLLAGMPDGILALDAEGKVTLVNDAARRLLGIEGTGRRRSPVELVKSAELQAAVDASMADGQGRAIEIVVRRPEHRLLSVNLVPFEGGLVLLVHDVTRVRRLVEARREMVANIGHELRTPLAAVLGYLETLEQDAGLSPADRAKFLGVIARNARRLERLVHDLSHLARLEASPASLAAVRVELGEAVRGALETLAPRARGKSIRLESAVPADLPAVKADPHGVETILLNLLDNAVRATPPGKSITIGGSFEGGAVRIRVMDQGPGIPRELRERVFERFFRLDPGRSSEEGGAGLGLAIVKHTVIRLGGEVGIDDAPGGGASFTLTLPCWEEDKEEVAG